MKITKESTGELTSLVTLEIHEEDYLPKVKKQLQNYRQKANIPGFRVGKVPESFIRKMYFEPLMADTISHIIGEELEKFVEEGKLDLFGRPIPNHEKQLPINFNTDKNFTFYYDIAEKPEVKIELNKKLSVPYYEIESSEKDVEKYLNEIVSHYGSRTNPEKSEKGDALAVKLTELDTDGNIKAEGLSVSSYLSLEKVKDAKSLKALIGVSVGDKVVINPSKAMGDLAEVSYLLSKTVDEVKNYSGNFELEVTDIQRITKAELNEELFAKVYEHDAIKTEAELRERIAKDISTTYAKEGEKKFLNDATLLLVKEANLILPDAFLKRLILENNAEAENEEKITPEQLEPQYLEYSDTLRWQIIENKLVEEFNLVVTRQDLIEEVKRALNFNMGEQTPEETNSFYDSILDSILKSKEEVNRISGRVLEDKLIKLMKEKLSVKTKKVTYEAFLKVAAGDIE